MTITEEEAKTKWCPFVRLTKCSTGSVVNNRGIWSDDANKCIASKCMAWRWVAREDYVFESSNLDFSKEDTVVRTETTVKNMRPATGFCGLAGQP